MLDWPGSVCPGQTGSEYPATSVLFSIRSTGDTGQAITPPARHHAWWKTRRSQPCCSQQRSRAIMTAKATRCAMWRSGAELLPSCWQGTEASAKSPPHDSVGHRTLTAD
jgi:hypothetical protein